MRVRTLSDKYISSYKKKSSALEAYSMKCVRPGLIWPTIHIQMVEYNNNASGHSKRIKE
jgi:hypothetical protein